MKKIVVFMGAVTTISMMQGCTTSHKSSGYKEYLPSRYSQTVLGIERHVRGTDSASYSFCDKLRTGYLYGCSYITPKNVRKTNDVDLSQLLANEPFAVVNFNFDSYFLTQDALDELELIDINKFKGKTVVLRGYTDSIGQNLYNEKLAQQRAKSVEDYFKNFIGLPNEIKTLGFGLCCYVVPNTTEVNREKNRRVEIFLE